MTNEQKAFCVQACINTYEDPDTGEGYHGKINWYGYDTKTLKKHYDETHVEWYSCIAMFPGMGKVTMIVFRGSDDKIDWRTNFDCKKIHTVINDNSKLVMPYNTSTGVMMHEGFYKAYQLVRDDIRKVAKLAWRSGLPVVVTGHSLGGALTTVCYIDLHHFGYDEQEMLHAEIKALLFGYAAASPAVGNKMFVDSFNMRARGNFHNEWFGSDTVHGVPTIWQGYRHVDIQKQWIDFWNALIIPFAAFTQWITLGALPSWAVWDHDPRRLLAAIQGKEIPMADADTRKDK